MACPESKRVLMGYLLNESHPYGGIDLLVVDLDAEAWTRLVTGGMAQNVIELSRADAD
jgi:hypothetical protein